MQKSYPKSFLNLNVKGIGKNEEKKMKIGKKQ